MADNRITFFHLPLEIEKNPNLTATDKEIAWIIFSVKGKNGHDHSCFYSNKNLAVMADCNPLTASRAIKKLVQEFVVISKVTADKSVGFRRELSINPKYKEYGEKFVDEYNRKVREQLGSRLIKSSIPIDKNINRGSEKSKDYGGLKKPLYNNDFYTFPLEKSGSCGTEQSTCQIKANPLSEKPRVNPGKEDKPMPVVVPPVSEDIVRVFNHWNNKGAPLPRHKVGTRIYRDAVKAIRRALKVHKEKTIRDAIDLYQQSLTRTDMNLCRFKSSPIRVGLDEFFQFSGFSVGVIFDRKIKGLTDGASWFDICLKGAGEVEKRFSAVPEDKFPIVTKMLQRVIGSWEDHPKVTGPIAQKQLQVVSSRLVEFHQRIKPRMLSGGFLKFSTPEFLKEYFVPYLQDMLATRGVEGFQLWWMIGDGFIDEFEQYLVRLQAIRRPVMVRHLKRRASSDQSIPCGSGSRTAYCHRYDNERELSAADFKNI